MGSFIVEKFREPPVPASQQGCGHDVTFAEFIKFFIFSETTGTHQDVHYVPVYQLCDVCRQHFDFIGKLETFSEDVQYIYSSVNESTDVGISSDLKKIYSRGLYFGNKFRKQNYSECMRLCDGYKQVWWGFQSMGFVPRSSVFPFSADHCENLTDISARKLNREFYEKVKGVYLSSKGKFEKQKQKDEFLRDMYKQVTLKDRLALQKVLIKDSELFGYPSFPEEVFPEYKKT